jgi:hypothetical protein
MARTEARIFVDIWTDADFIALPGPAQRMYLFLLSQPDIAHDGVIALRPRRWARASAGLTEQAVQADLDVLAAGRYVVMDDDAEELLVRSFIRRDRVYMQPNLLLAARKHLSMITSQAIRTALVDELHRVLAEDDLTAKCADIVRGMLEDLAKGSPMGTPDPTRSALGEGGVVTAVTTGFPYPLDPSPLAPLPPAAASQQPPRGRAHVTSPAAGPRPPTAAKTPEPEPDPAAMRMVTEASDASAEEAAAVLAEIRRTKRVRDSLPGLVRTIIGAGELPKLLDTVRAATAKKRLADELAEARAGPDCQHGNPGGRHVRSDTGKPYCPQCALAAAAA